MGTDDMHVLAVAAGRYSSRTHLSHLIYDISFKGLERFKEYFTGCINNGRLDFGVAVSLTWEDYLVCYVIRDDFDLFCYCIFTFKYPLRLGLRFIDELAPIYESKFRNKIQTAKENDLVKSSKEMLQIICAKYDDVTKVDSLYKAHTKLNEVKNTMSESITVMIENTESVESIYTLAKDMNEEAQIFKRNSSKLKNQMRCRVYKVSHTSIACNCDFQRPNNFLKYIVCLQWKIITAVVLLLVLGVIAALVYLFVFSDGL
jgi:hypothetical protein